MRLWPLLALLSAAFAAGNGKCWSEDFTHSRCCNVNISPRGDPRCWDSKEFTYRNCCFSKGVTESGSTEWSITNLKDLGAWMVHEMQLFVDDDCTMEARKHIKVIESGHKAQYDARHVFDKWVKPTDQFFWYSDTGAPRSAWVGAKYFGPVEVRCVKVWHNNIPSMGIALQRRNEAGDWEEVKAFPDVVGGEWATMKVVQSHDSSEL